MQRRLPFSEHIPGELIKDINQLQSGDDVYIEFSRKITNIFPELRKFRAKYSRTITDITPSIAEFTSVIPIVEELEVPEEYVIHDLTVDEGQAKFAAFSLDKNQDIKYINNQRLFGYVGDVIDDKSETLRVRNIKLLINILNITLKSIAKEYVRIYKTTNETSFLKNTKSSFGGKKKKRTTKKIILKTNRKTKKTGIKRKHNYKTA